MDRRVKKKTEYQELRSRLIRRGTNIARWARTHGYPLMTVYNAARGERGGVKSVRILHELEQEAANGSH